MIVYPNAVSLGNRPRPSPHVGGLWTRATVWPARHLPGPGVPSGTDGVFRTPDVDQRCFARRGNALGDWPADPVNTFTYTINLSACVATAPGVTWGVLKLPVQMMNVYGDNSAQNIHFVRDDS